jgi:hypothetical protein
MRTLPGVLLALAVALGLPAAAEAQQLTYVPPNIAIIMVYHGSGDPHWAFKAHEFADAVKELTQLSFDEDYYHVEVFPAEFETMGLVKVTNVNTGKTYVIHQVLAMNPAEHEEDETELAYAFREAVQFTDHGQKGFIAVIPAFVDRGGEHQTQEIPALLWALEHEYKMPKFAVHYEPFGLVSWDRENNYGVAPKLAVANIEYEAQKPLVGPNQEGQPQGVFANFKTLGDVLKYAAQKHELGVLEIAFGTLRIGFWKDFVANMEYVLRGVVNYLNEKYGADIKLLQGAWVVQNGQVVFKVTKPGEAYFYAFNNPAIGVKKWGSLGSRWDIRYMVFKDIMKEFYQEGVRYVLVYPYQTVTGITDRMLFEGNPENGPEGQEPPFYGSPKTEGKYAILRHFHGVLLAETKADVEKYIATYQNSEWLGNGTYNFAIYMDTRIYEIPPGTLGDWQQQPMYIMYVRRALMDAPNGVQELAKVFTSYVDTYMAEWLTQWLAGRQLYHLATAQSAFKPPTTQGQQQVTVQPSSQYPNVVQVTPVNPLVILLALPLALALARRR